MSYITPKTNWSVIDGVDYNDLNRIEGNTEQNHNDIDAEETARIAADSAESAARIAADSAEESARTAADAAEATARGNADNAHAALTNPHGATDTNTASRIILRDASGNAKVSNPLLDSDIDTKGARDTADEYYHNTLITNISLSTRPETEVFSSITALLSVGETKKIHHCAIYQHYVNAYILVVTHINKIDANTIRLYGYNIQSNTAVSPVRIIMGNPGTFLTITSSGTDTFSLHLVD